VLSSPNSNPRRPKDVNARLLRKSAGGIRGQAKMSEILKFTGLSRIPEKPEAILEKAKDWGMERCLVLGWKSENGKLVFGGSHCEVADLVLLLEAAKKALLDDMKVWA
jgi:hypothetical protein